MVYKSLNWCRLLLHSNHPSPSHFVPMNMKPFPFLCRLLKQHSLKLCRPHIPLSVVVAFGLSSLEQPLRLEHWRLLNYNQYLCRNKSHDNMLLKSMRQVHMSYRLLLIYQPTLYYRLDLTAIESYMCQYHPQA